MVKNVDYYMALNYKMVISYCQSGKYYIGEIKEFPGFTATGESLTELITDARATKREWLGTAIMLEREIAEPIAFVQAIAI